MSRAVAAACAVLSASLAACARHATLAECTALVDHYVELVVHEQNPKADDVEIAKHRAAWREKAAQDPSFASCPKEVSAKDARCAMQAPNVDDFERCLVTLE
jgi:hypothetical protein